jgi:hypothetical protein
MHTSPSDVAVALATSRHRGEGILGVVISLLGSLVRTDRRPMIVRTMARTIARRARSDAPALPAS